MAETETTIGALVEELHELRAKGARDDKQLFSLEQERDNAVRRTREWQEIALTKQARLREADPVAEIDWGQDLIAKMMRVADDLDSKAWRVIPWRLRWALGDSAYALRQAAAVCASWRSRNDALAVRLREAERDRDDAQTAQVANEARAIAYLGERDDALAVSRTFREALGEAEALLHRREYMEAILVLRRAQAVPPSGSVRSGQTAKPPERERPMLCAVCSLPIEGHWSVTEDDKYVHHWCFSDDPDLSPVPAVEAPDRLGKFGHHPDETIDAEVEIGRLEGLLAEAHGGLLRALDFATASPEGLSIKADVRDALRRTGRPEGTWGAASERSDREKT